MGLYNVASFDFASSGTLPLFTSGAGFSVIGAPASMPAHTRACYMFAERLSLTNGGYVAVTGSPTTLLLGMSISLDDLAGANPITNGYTAILDLYTDTHTGGSSNASVAAVIMQPGENTLRLWINSPYVAGGAGPIGSVVGVPSIPLSIDERHYLLLTTNISTGTTSFYLDGRLVATDTRDWSSLGASFSGYGIFQYHSYLGPASPATGVFGFISDHLVYTDTTQLAHLLAAGTGVFCTADLPSADGHFHGWFPNSGSTHYNRINEVPSDEGTTYLADGGALTDDSWLHAGHTALPASAVVLATKYFLRAESSSGTPQIAPFFYNGASGAIGGAFTVNSTYTYYASFTTVSPFTSVPWTVSELSSVQIGIRSVNGVGFTHLTQAALEVLYYAAPQEIDGVGQASTYASGTASVVKRLRIDGIGTPSSYASGTASVSLNSLTIHGIGQASTYASGTATLVQGQTIYGIGTASSYESGVATVPHVSTRGVPMFVDQDYTVDGNVLTFTILPYATDPYWGYYAELVGDPVHRHRYVSKTTWPNNQWVLPSQPLPGSIHIYASEQSYIPPTPPVPPEEIPNFWAVGNPVDNNFFLWSAHYDTTTGIFVQNTSTFFHNPLGAGPGLPMFIIAAPEPGVVFVNCYDGSASPVTQYLYRFVMQDHDNGTFELLDSAALDGGEFAYGQNVHVISSNELYWVHFGDGARPPIAHTFHYLNGVITEKSAPFSPGITLGGANIAMTVRKSTISGRLWLKGDVSVVGGSAYAEVYYSENDGGSWQQLAGSGIGTVASYVTSGSFTLRPLTTGASAIYYTGGTDNNGYVYAGGISPSSFSMFGAYRYTAAIGDNYLNMPLGSMKTPGTRFMSLQIDRATAPIAITSTNYGATWSLLPAPPGVFMSISPDDLIVALPNANSPSSFVYTSGDGGQTWHTLNFFGGAVTDAAFVGGEQSGFILPF